MSKKTRLILIIIGAVLAVAIVTGGIIAISNAVKKNKQSKCEHEYGDVAVVTEATCETKGLTLQICTLCEYELTEEIPAFGHTEYVINAKPATCLESGLSDGITCITCNKTIVPQATIPALGHNVVTDNARAATCVTYGLTQGSHCKRCGEIVKAQDKIPATGHSITVQKGYAATCLSAGLTDGSSCEKCGTVYSPQEVIEPLAHNIVDNVCELCGFENYNFEDPTTYTMQDVSVGDKVGGWYRLYRYSGQGTWKTMSITCTVNGIVGQEQVVNEDITINLCVFNTQFCNDEKNKNAIINLPLMGGPTPTSELNYVVYDEYIDVYLAPGYTI